MAVAAETTYLSLDTIPGVAEARQRVRDEAWALVAEREALSTQPDFELPPSVDALSTADEVLLARKTYGVESPEYQDRHSGLQLDCLRLVAEWYRKKRPEYFTPSRHRFDAHTQDYFSHGFSTRSMTTNALRPIDGNPEEVGRRVNERVEDETPRILRGLGGAALRGTGIRTISDCTDKAIADYQHDIKTGAPHRGYDGYVPEIEKKMIRDMRVDPLTGDRFQEQLALPGIYITTWVIKKALRRCGFEAGEMDKTALHGTQLAVRDDLMEFAAQLDEIAGEEWCTNIFMGEEVPADFIKDYENFRAEAVKRQESLKDVADTVAVFVLDLAEDGFDRAKAPGHVEAFVKKLLLDMATADVSVAEQMFDAKTAQGLQQVGWLRSQGRHDEAFELMRQVEAAAPGGGFCGAGSCGLEAVNEHGKAGAALREKLQAEAGDKLVKDKERICKCGAKDIVYAYSKHKVNKYCENCGAFESKRTDR